MVHYEHTEVKALIWDVDGVLVDTERLHFTAWQKLLEELGHMLTIEQYRPMIGRGGEENMAAMCATKGVTGNQAELTARRNAIYQALRQQGIPVIVENVIRVRDFDQKFPELIQVAASSAERKYVDENIKATGLAAIIRFALSLGDDPAIQPKPAPDLYLAAVGRLGLPAENCLAFEDTEVGVTAAKAAGVSVVALPNVLTAGQDFSAADLVIVPGDLRSAKNILDRRK